jgi:phage portal protein BeeE
MNVLESIFSKIGYVKASTQGEVGPLMRGYAMGTGASSWSSAKSYSQLVDSYKSWVYTCIDKIAKSVAMIPLGLYVYRETGKGKKVKNLSWRGEYKRLPPGDRPYFLKEAGMEKERIYTHPFLDLVSHPNSFMTRFGLWYETMIRLELGGLCGWLIVTDGLKVPRQIFPLPLTKSALLTPKVTPTMELQGWQYRDGQVDQSFTPDEVLLFKYASPVSPFHAMSPLMAQTYPYDIDLFLMQQQRAFFDNMATPGLHLWTDQKLNKGQVDEMREIVDEQFGSAIKAGKTLITHSGLKAEKLMGTARDSMIDEVARFAREKLITSYDLSEGKIGLVRDVNRANMEALDKTFVEDCLGPRCMLMEEVVETFFLPRYDTGLTCDFELPDVSEKLVSLAERAQNLNTLYSCINEERAKEGLPPVPWGDKPWAPFTLSQVGSAPPPSASPAEEEEGEEEEEEGTKKGLEVKRMTPEFWTAEKKGVAWKMFVRRSEAEEKKVLGPVQTYFRSLQTDVLKRLETNSKRVEGTYAGWSRAKILAHLPTNKDARGINIDKGEEATRLRSLMTPLIKSIMQDTGDDRIMNLRETVKFDIGFNLNDPAVVKWLGTRMREFSKEVAGTTFDEIEAILRTGFSEGQPTSAIAATLMEKFESWEQYRAPLIARTETIAAMNKADLEAVSQTGLDEVLLKHWLTAGDEAVRDSHNKAGMDYADGIPIDGMFEVGQDRMDAPGNGKVGEENINCRCTVYYTEKESEVPQEPEKPGEGPASLVSVGERVFIDEALEGYGVQEGIDLIDQVVGVEKAYTFRIQELSAAGKKNKVLGRVSLSKNKRWPVKWMEVDPGSSRVEKKETVLHEMGHVIDHAHLQKGKIGFSSNILKGDMKKWGEAVTKSKYYKSLVSKKGRAVEGMAESAYEGSMVEYLDYIMRTEELFARSFSQYIGMKTNDIEIMHQMDTWSKHIIPYAWKTDDFKPIYKALDDLFAKKGMLKETIKWLISLLTKYTN